MPALFGPIVDIAQGLLARTIHIAACEIMHSEMLFPHVVLLSFSVGRDDSCMCAWQIAVVAA